VCATPELIAATKRRSTSSSAGLSRDPHREPNPDWTSCWQPRARRPRRTSPRQSAREATSAWKNEIATPWSDANQSGYRCFEARGASARTLEPERSALVVGSPSGCGTRRAGVRAEAIVFVERGRAPSVLLGDDACVSSSTLTACSLTACASFSTPTCAHWLSSTIPRSRLSGRSRAARGDLHRCGLRGGARRALVRPGKKTHLDRRPGACLAECRRVARRIDSPRRRRTRAAARVPRPGRSEVPGSRARRAREFSHQERRFLDLARRPLPFRILTPRFCRTGYVLQETASSSTRR